MPAASPTDTPVITRPISSPGRSGQAASTPIATIIAATDASIVPRRPMRAAMALSRSSTAIERLAYAGAVPTTASDESSYVAAIDLVVDGGMKVW